MRELLAELGKLSLEERMMLIHEAFAMPEKVVLPKPETASVPEPAAEPIPENEPGAPYGTPGNMQGYPTFDAAHAREEIGKRPRSAGEPQPKKRPEPARYPPLHKSTAQEVLQPPPPPPPRPCPPMCGDYGMAHVMLDDGTCALCPSKMCTDGHMTAARHLQNVLCAKGLDYLCGGLEGGRCRRLHVGASGPLTLELIHQFWGFHFRANMGAGADFASLAHRLLLSKGVVKFKSSLRGKEHELQVAQVVESVSCWIVSYHLGCRKYEGQIMFPIQDVNYWGVRVAGVPNGTPTTTPISPPDGSSWWPTIKLNFSANSGWQDFKAFVCVYQLLRDDPTAWLGN